MLPSGQFVRQRTRSIHLFLESASDEPRRAIEPIADHWPVANRLRPAKQNQERGLGGIVDVGRGSKPAPADGTDTGCMPEDQRRKGPFVPERQELSQQIRIRTNIVS